MLPMEAGDSRIREELRRDARLRFRAGVLSLVVGVALLGAKFFA